MYNYFMLMGRVLEEPNIEEIEDGKRKCIIKLSVTRNFPNSQGERSEEHTSELQSQR